MKRYFPPKSLLVVLLIYFISRLFYLGKLPMFVDESIYIYWAKLILDGQANPFYSLFDGKPPLFIWSLIPGLFFSTNQTFLWLSRLVSVFFGAFTVVGVFLFSRDLFNSKKVGLWSASVYMMLPMVLQYDRLALMDGMLTAWFIWSLFLFWRYIQDRNWKYLLGTFICVGAGYATKPAGVLITVLLFIVMLHPLLKEYLAQVKGVSKQQKLRIKLIFQENLSSLIKVLRRNKHLIFAWIVTTLPVIFVNGVFRFSSSYPQFVAKNQMFQRNLGDILELGFGPIFENITLLSVWLTQYYTWPFVVMAVIGFVYLFKKDRLIASLLLCLWIVPLFGFALKAKILFPRYVLFSSLFPSILVGWSLAQVSKTKNYYTKYISLISLMAVVYISNFNYLIIFNPAEAPYPQPDYDQLVLRDPSSYALEPIRNHLDTLLLNGSSVSLYTDGTFGLLPYYFELYYWDNPQVSITSEWPLEVDDSGYYVLKAETSFSELDILIEGQNPSQETLYRLGYLSE